MIGVVTSSSVASSWCSAELGIAGALGCRLMPLRAQVRLWDIPYALLTGHTGAVASVVFSPDGRTLASAGADQTVRLWEINVDRAIQRICATTTNTLTTAKWEQYVSKDLPYRPPCP